MYATFDKDIFHECWGFIVKTNTDMLNKAEFYKSYWTYFAENCAHNPSKSSRLRFL